MKEFSSSDSYYNLWMLLAQVRRAILRSREQELKKHGISATQSAVLFVIEVCGGKATPVEIARWLFREYHTVSELLVRMEERGLIRKVKELDRRNLVRVYMTVKAKRIHRQSAKSRIIQKTMSSLSDEELQQLGTILEKLWRTAISELGVEYFDAFP